MIQVVAVDRRTAIADAAIDVIATAGLDALSVRNVARASGVSQGAVQHHYPAREALLIGALDRMVERQLARIDRTGTLASPLEALRLGVRALLPLDEPRRREGIVWIAFAAAAGAAHAPVALAERYAAVVALTRRRAEEMIDLGARLGEVRPRFTAADAAAVVMAAIDGLIIHSLVRTTSRRRLVRLADGVIDAVLMTQPGGSTSKTG
jgi:AcrR family transcriptional regulator